MELRRLAVLAWRWLWLVLLTTLLAASASYFVSKHQIPIYQATSILLVSQAKAPAVMDTSVAYATSDRLSATYAELLGRRPVMAQVIQNLGLKMSPAELSRAVIVEPIRNTQLIRVSVEDTNLERAAAIANEIPRVFIEQNDRMQKSRFADLEGSLQAQIEATRDEITRQQQSIAELRAAENSDQVEIDRQQRDLTEMQSHYSELYRSFDLLKSDEANQLDTLIVTELAEATGSPIRPKTASNTLLAAMIGFVIGAGIAFAVEYLDDVLKNPDEIQAALGLTTLTAVPAIDAKPGGDELAVLSKGHSSAAEAYRLLRTNLQFAAVGKPLRSILITSPSPTDGKTLTVANLGAALAQAGQTVILVDADLHRPRLHQVFRLPNNVGLTTALLENCNLPDILQNTGLLGLRILASGLLPPNPAELLGSSRMRQILDSLTYEANVVIFDSPPVMSLSDTAILATQVEGVLLVLDASSTRRELAKRAVASLRQVQARLVGVVLNRVSTRGADAYYYYYDRDAGHYHQDDHSVPRLRRWCTAVTTAVATLLAAIPRGGFSGR